MGRGTALTVKRGLLGAAGVPAYQFDGAAVGSARGSAWLCHWVQQLLQLLPSCARQLQAFVTVVLQEGGRKGGGHRLPWFPRRDPQDAMSP